VSLDVYLYGPEQTVACRCRDCEHEHTRIARECFYTANVTHNLGKMAAEAGIYAAMWRPDEHGITRAEQLIAPLADGLKLLRARPTRFEPLNPSNGWGSYERFVPWVEKYLAACKAHPDAMVEVSR
jgi:hypothetical protein